MIRTVAERIGQMIVYRQMKSVVNEEMSKAIKRPVNWPVNGRSLSISFRIRITHLAHICAAAGQSYDDSRYPGSFLSFYRCPLPNNLDSISPTIHPNQSQLVTYAISVQRLSSSLKAHHGRVDISGQTVGNGGECSSLVKSLGSINFHRNIIEELGKFRTYQG